ncbi:peptidoglycan-binding protein [Caproiciproducens galactitolivorans]|uniref:peptidoglycan-binding domain-containing protein n=1 Tax=Caproiciproducens galactitolivorans TaxID=642589 RepID=UPI00240A3F35|nr:peptidoglycan-binding domain-containing protein [Caproiciproducens galactitolivorans]
MSTSAVKKKTGAGTAKKIDKKPAEPKKEKQVQKQTATAAGSWEVARELKVTKPLMKGDDVKALQTALIARGFHCGIGGASGIYEKNTALAVRHFQSMNRLIVDGKAGKFTVTALGGIWKE